MRHLSPRRQAERNRESGFTLAEVTVAMALTVILSVAAFATVDSVVSATDSTQQRLTNTSQSQLVLDRITKDLRAATATGGPVLVGDPPAAVQYADSNHITFYASLSAPDTSSTSSVPVGGVGPQQVDIRLDTTGVLTETVTTAVPLTGTNGWASGWTWPSNRSSVFTTSGIDTTQGALFSYYGAAVDPTAAGSTPLLSTPPSPGMTPATTPSSSLIDTVSVDLWIRQSTNPTAPSTELKSAVHLRNVDFSQTSN